MISAWLGLGSNLGARELRLRQALQKLQAPELRLLRQSQVYETEPQGKRDQPWFLNLAAEFETTLSPLQLLHRAQRVELELGRERGGKDAPRTVDIDLLLYGGTLMKSAELTLPHPRFRQRRFVLAPLAELEPKLRDPETGQTVAELLGALADEPGQNVRERGAL